VVSEPKVRADLTVTSSYEIGSVEEGLLLEGEMVGYPSVSLSHTLGRIEKVEQYIRKKTHKPTALRFWVEGGVIPLCGLAHFSFL